ncbi:FkbM family methyltransferase [Pontixanthobacter sp.]|uniref:FkbM family methyltransferase n=1 Tax=Pontixanthobacter sp. TaxID=2792078 RepID=UPI003C7D72B4
MKYLLRSLVPASMQVPVKYMINKWRKQLEPEMELLPFLAKPGERALDIGGNRGLYTYALWRLGSKVDVFEPNPECSKVLTAWASNKKTVVVHTVGLSNETGEAELHIPLDKFGNAHDASASLNRSVSATTRDERIVLSTLDSFAFDMVSVVKIDVEGHEYNALMGGKRLFQSQRPSLIVEIEQRHNTESISNIFCLIKSWGYCGYFLRAGKLVDLELFDLHKDQNLENLAKNIGSYINNFLFLHTTRLEQGSYTDLISKWGPK